MYRILKCDHSLKNCWAVLYCGAVCFSIFTMQLEGALLRIPLWTPAMCRDTAWTGRRWGCGGSKRLAGNTRGCYAQPRWMPRKVIAKQCKPKHRGLQRKWTQYSSALWVTSPGNSAALHSYAWTCWLHGGARWNRWSDVFITMPRGLSFKRKVFAGSLAIWNIKYELLTRSRFSFIYFTQFILLENFPILDLALSWVKGLHSRNQIHLLLICIWNDSGLYWWFAGSVRQRIANNNAKPWKTWTFHCQDWLIDFALVNDGEFQSPSMTEMEKFPT